MPAVTAVPAFIPAASPESWEGMVFLKTSFNDGVLLRAAHRPAGETLLCFV